MITDVKVGLRFGEWLVENKFLTHEQFTDALSEQQVSGGRLGQVVCRLGMLGEDKMTAALAEYLAVEYENLDDITKIDLAVARQVPENIAKRYCLIALRDVGDHILVSIADPLDVVAIDTVCLKLQREIKVVISSEKKIRQVIEVVYHGSDIEEQRLRDLVEVEVLDEEELAGPDLTATDLDVDSGANQAPVIRFVDLLLSQGIKSRASDIHIEPQENSMVIRMRVDGVLCSMLPPARKMQPAVIARIKILSKMNIAERRLPQDGRFKIRSGGRDIDVRVSVIPVIYGEKVVLRILDASAADYNLANLRFGQDMLEQFQNVLSQPHGIIIVTGPTGSGKTTTLYSALNYLQDPTKNITTVEDPVEYRLAGINQIQVKPQIDLDFATCLRAILRQDPDIILIGEIRDLETVEIALKASLTGHLVLSTFHTNDAPGTLSRLIYMGVAPYLLASALKMVVAQRLVRKICDFCKEPVELDEQHRQRLQAACTDIESMTLYQGKGCEHCSGSGYMGRLAIFEFLPMSSDLAVHLAEGATESQIRQIARGRGYTGLMESAVAKMKEGLTTAEEVFRVTYVEGQ